MKSILVNYEYCTGCRSCELACRNELGLGHGESGIVVSEVGPIQFKTDIGLSGEPYDWVFMPVLTRACNLCETRVAGGKLPSCVQACQAWCLYHGEVAELAEKIDGKTRWALLSI
jgi:Fe-S-cluster-containing dehydrogenase component